MRPITWIHISDFHLRDSQAWAQDVVLSALCRDIERRRGAAGRIDFVLATGDLAFSGQAQEYDRAATFLDEVLRVTGVPRERLFCVPGNHDVDRDRQRMCFVGARHILQSENEIDVFLESREEVETLLQRQDSYRQFQETYFGQQERRWTSDGLGYVSPLAVEGVRIAVVGFNTAWLSEGGVSDHGRLVAGERQVIEALRIAEEADPHLVVAMGHHPFHLLNDFDRRVVQRRIEEACHFYHCGHLHEAEWRAALNAGAHCLTVAAGASFESRHARNAYCSVHLDIMQAQQAITTSQYNPTDGAFSYESRRTLPFVIDTVGAYEFAELAEGIASFRPALKPLAHYLSALLLDIQGDMPILWGGEYVLGSFDALRGQEDGDMKAAAVAFMALRNPLRLFSGRMALRDFLERFGEALAQYGTLLVELGTADLGMRKKLDERERSARTLAGVQPLPPFAHTVALLRELAAEQDWDRLREHAERHLDSPSEAVAGEARRKFALSLAQSDDNRDRARAAEVYVELVAGGAAEAGDFAALASLLTGSGEHESAKQVLLDGMERFPAHADGYLAIGQRIVEATGDRVFRDQLAALRARRSS
jgi:hypothetical protein